MPGSRSPVSSWGGRTKKAMLTTLATYEAAPTWARESRNFNTQSCRRLLRRGWAAVGEKPKSNLQVSQVLHTHAEILLGKMGNGVCSGTRVLPILFPLHLWSSALLRRCWQSRTISGKSNLNTTTRQADGGQGQPLMASTSSSKATSHQPPATSYQFDLVS